MIKPDFDKITPEWFQDKKKEYNLTLDDISEATGQSKSYLSLLINGKSNMTPHFKSAIFYLFKVLELTGFKKVKKGNKVALKERIKKNVKKECDQCGAKTERIFCTNCGHMNN